ncbi:nucleotidyltransferase family protein [Aestuariivirga sp.]|uniref:nucleotidyltransferase family protein n=1 Tax=Aestuariivirga sp. TaxID=2650926 RepID=UPI0025BAFF44|nr:nucleotidyltransferase family protein [Aestuariivirga sp.]MCA3555956.1 nucleotidyltransferase family protein [Aestuariivirga sp.]
MTPGTHAMVLAAGHGLRLRPLTLARPKPLVEVAGKALIDHGFDRLRAAGVETAVVNVHYLAAQIEAWARRQSAPRIVISDERAELLDTGGGVAKALPLLGNGPFFVINSDSFWLDEGAPALDRLRAAWDDRAMDCLLLLSPLDRTVGYDGKGDFTRAEDGRLSRRATSQGTPLAYIGGYLASPRIFAAAPRGAFSMNLLWDRAIAAGRLFGVEHAGRWLHVGTPGAIALAEAALGA